MRGTIEIAVPSALPVKLQVHLEPAKADPKPKP